MNKETLKVGLLAFLFLAIAWYANRWHPARFMIYEMPYTVTREGREEATRVMVRLDTQSGKTWTFQPASIDFLQYWLPISEKLESDGFIPVK